MLSLTFFLGIICNAIGYIPPGNINLTAVQITLNKGIKQAYYFILAFSSVEVLFTFGVMRFVQWLSNTINLSQFIDMAMIVVFLIMGVITWRSRKEMPMQIPFWLFVGTYLMSHDWVQDGFVSLSIFSIGSGIGAGLVLYGFARFARYIQDKFTISSYLVNKSIAILFFALAGYHIVKVVYVQFFR
jgi:hypothetical protein